MNSHPAASKSQTRSLTPTELLPLLCCPLCKGELVAIEAALHCPSCSRDYPIVLGIPDLRAYPDPYIGFADDHRKGERLQARAELLNFAELVRFYWEITPEAPRDLRQHFIRHVLSDEERAAEWLECVRPVAQGGSRLLDVGCGTGALLKAACGRFSTLIGCDIAFRWLVVARKRLDESHVPAQLVCCCADYLPFPKGCFDAAAAISLLEHLPRGQEVALRECARVLRPAGAFWVISANRYSLGREPHVHVWGVGFLPRRWMAAYVRWRRGLPYDKFRRLSVFDVRRMFRGAGFERVALSVPRIGEADLRTRGATVRAAARVFQFLSRIPLLGRLLILVSPLVQVVGFRSAE